MEGNSHRHASCLLCWNSTGDNTSELAACGNPVPATAPHRCGCACANTHSLFNSLHQVFLAADQISTRHSLQPGICEGGQGTAGRLMTQTHHCQPKRKETSTALSWASSSLLQEAFAATPGENDLSPRGTHVRPVGAVWFAGCGCRRARKRARFSARAAARVGEHPLAWGSHQHKAALEFVKHSDALGPQTECYCK